MNNADAIRKQIQAALKAYQEGDIEGSYQLIKMYERHLTPLQIQQRILSTVPSRGQWQIVMTDWLDLACQQMRIELGLDENGVLIKPLAALALKTALSVIDDG